MEFCLLVDILTLFSTSGRDEGKDQEKLIWRGNADIDEVILGIVNIRVTIAQISHLRSLWWLQGSSE
jgi:hypothetical protein